MKKKNIRWLLVVLVIASTLSLSACKKKEDNTDDTSEETTENDSGSDVDDSNGNDVVVDPDGESPSDDVNDNGNNGDSSVNWSDFSQSSQNLGNSDDKEESEYTLESIDDQARNGFHRITFNLSSDDEQGLPSVDAKLVSSGGYIQLVLDRVTQDNSGIGYQSSRAINKQGVIKLYHDVSANQSEEIYNIGIEQNTEFYLYEGDDMSVILDVKYPGSAEDGESEDDREEESDSGEFGTSNQTISGTNTSGTARIGTYTWGVETNVLKFVWNTSASSGKPIPETHAEYDSSSNVITVTFEGVEKDFIADGFETSLSSPVSGVAGQRSGDTSTYTFALTKDTEYRIYKSLSPNQVILEIKR